VQGTAALVEGVSFVNGGHGGPQPVASAIALDSQLWTLNFRRSIRGLCWRIDMRLRKQ